MDGWIDFDEHFSSGRGPRGRQRDGRRFETFVKLVLDALARQESPPVQWGWRKPQGGADGSRDFQRLVDGALQFAEAKNYARPLGLLPISPTLVVASNYEARQLLLFSASVLSKRARRHMALHARQSGMLARSYDGPRLDALAGRLLGGDDEFVREISRFFPRLLSDYRALPGTDRADSPISGPRIAHALAYRRDPLFSYAAPDAFTESDDGADDERVDPPLDTLTIRRDELLACDLILENLSVSESLRGVAHWEVPGEKGACADPMTAALHIARPLDPTGSDEPDPEVVRKSVDFSLAPGEICAFRELFLPVRDGADLPPPSVRLEIEGGTVVRAASSGALRLSVSTFLQPRLCGKRFLEAREKVAELLVAGEGGLCAVVRGPSGAGKTRLLREMRREAIVHRRQVYSLQAGGGSRSSLRDFLLHFITLHEGVPAQVLFDPSSTVRDKAGEAAAVRHRLAAEHDLRPPRLPDESAPAASEIDRAVAYLERALRRTDGVLLIDNLQDFDEATIELLVRLRRRLESARRPVVIWSVNTDATARLDALAALTQDVERRARDEPARTLLVDLSTWTDDEARLLLSECIAHRGDRDDAFRIEAFADRFFERVERKPFDIIQTLHFLSQAPIDGGPVLERVEGPLRSGDLFIRDGLELGKLLDIVPREIETVLARRWELLIESAPEQACSASRICEALSIFVTLRPGDLRRLLPDGSDRALALLRRAGFLRTGLDEPIQFDHRRLFDFFAERFSSTLSDPLLRFARDPAIIEAHSLACRLVEFRASPDPPHLPALLHAAAEGLARNETPELIRPVAAAWAEHAQRYVGDLTSEALADVMKVAAVVKKRVDFEACEKLLAMLPPVGDLGDRRPDGTRYVAAVRERASALIRLRRDDCAHDLLLETEAGLSRLAFDETDRSAGVERARADLCDRLCVAARSINRLPQALCFGRRMLAIGRTLDDPRLVAQAHIELGYVYLGPTPRGSRGVARGSLVEETRRRRARLQAHWSRALDIAHSNKRILTTADDPMANPRIIAYHQLFAALVDGAYESVVSNWPAAYTLCQEAQDVFHLVKLDLLRAEALLCIALSKGAVEREALKESIQRAKDLAGALGFAQTHWASWFLYGKAASLGLLGWDTNPNPTRYQQAWEALLEICGRAPLSAIYADMLELLLVESIEQGANDNWLENRIARVGNPLVQDRMRETLKAVRASGGFEAYQPATTIAVGRHAMPWF